VYLRVQRRDQTRVPQPVDRSAGEVGQESAPPAVDQEPAPACQQQQQQHQPETEQGEPTSREEVSNGSRSGRTGVRVAAPPGGKSAGFW